MELTEVLPETVFAFFLVFVRLGAIFMLLPGFGEAFVPQRIRLGLALAVTAALFPLVRSDLPAEPTGILGLAGLIFGEVLIGAFIGATARLALAGLHVAGTVIAFQSSLGAAQFFDPAQNSQGAVVASFLSIFGLVLIFASDLHLMMLRAVFDSYALFSPAEGVPLASFAELATRFVAGSFNLGIQIAAPFIVYGLVLYIGMGLINRLMPQMQVFFIVMPLQIMLAFVFLMITLGAVMVWFLNYFEGAIAAFRVGA